MFWNSKLKSPIEKARIETGRDVERALVILSEIAQSHRASYGGTYSLELQKFNDTRNDPRASHEQKVAAAQVFVDFSTWYKDYITRIAVEYGDFIDSKLEMYEMLIHPAASEGKVMSKEIRWVELAREACSIQMRNVQASSVEIGIDQAVPKIVIENRGDDTLSTTEEESEAINSALDLYYRVRDGEIDDESNNASERDNLSADLFGSREEYLEGGSYKKLLDIIR